MVRVENVTRQQTLVEGGRLADNHWTRLRGLIGVRHLPAGDGMLIKPCRGVHCMFMSISIDVVYVDRSDHVVAVDKGMRPWSVGKIRRQSAYVLELPPGAIDATHTQPGDQLAVSLRAAPAQV